MWLDPIIDRTQTDIINRTSKAFLNVADWTRIDGNTQEMKTQVDSLLGTSIVLNPLTEPAMAIFRGSGNINALIENINKVRIGASLPAATGILPLKQNYIAGNGSIAPNYENVNAWELTLFLIHDLLPKAMDYQVYCGVAACGQARFWQARFR